MPIVPIVDVDLESNRDLYVRIGRCDVGGAPLLSIMQFCPFRKCTTAGESCSLDESILDERMAES